MNSSSSINFLTLPCCMFKNLAFEIRLGARRETQFGHNGRALLLADAQTYFGAQTVEAALDIEQRVDTPDRLQCDRRDRRCVLSVPCIGGNVGQFEELPPGMGPAQRRCDRSRSTRGIVERIVAAVGIGLRDAGEVLKMLRGIVDEPPTSCERRNLRLQSSQPEFYQ